MNIKHIPILNLMNAQWFKSKRFLLLFVICTAAFILYFITTFSASSSLQQVKKRGELVVLTRNASTTYFEGPDGETGFEYDLATLFAKELGVKLVMKVPDAFTDVFPLLSGSNADMVAAGVSITEKRRKNAQFSQPYFTVTQQLVYRVGKFKRPRNMGEIAGKRLAVVDGTTHLNSLKNYQKQYPKLTWDARQNVSSEELLEEVQTNQTDFTIADSNEISVSRRFYPELRVAFNVSGEETIAWAFKKSNDTSLVNAANHFLDKVKKNGVLTQLIERHFGHIKKFNYVEKRVFLQHIANRLPLYELSFKQAAKETGIDWRLLAAVGYQESHWDPLATSPTGVRGLMMLTNATAAEMSVKNRLDPRQSIFAGSRYLKKSIDKISHKVKNPDRVWMGMAAYNIGFGHLEDARVLAQRFKKNPNVWVDVKTTLPLLSKRKYNRLTKHGYARGYEPVHYVTNIRNYYDILIWHSEHTDSLDDDKQNNASNNNNDVIIQIEGPSAL